MSSLQRFSGISLTSRTTHGIEEEPNYEDMTDEELKEQLELTIHTNEILTLENDIFERYLHRSDSQSLVSMVEVLKTAKAISSQITQISSSHFRVSNSMSGFSMRGRNTSLSPISVGSIQTFTGSRGFQTSIAQPLTRGLRIALSQRIEMANKEIDEMKKELEEREKETIKKKANLHAQIEEIKMRIRDTNKARDELEENVVKKGVDPSTGKILSEKFIRYIDTWLKNADRLIDKLRLKSSTIKSQIKKAKIQLQQRNELGQNLRLVDFQALAIENEDYSKQIEEKTQQLMELKKMSGQYNFKLCTCKDKLNEQQMTLNNIKKQINIKEKQIQKLNTDLETTTHQLEKMEQHANKISKSINGHEIKMDDVAEIIKVHAELQEMKKTYTRLMRHGNIQLETLKSINKHLQLIDQIKSGTIPA